MLLFKLLLLFHTITAHCGYAAATGWIHSTFIIILTHFIPIYHMSMGVIFIGFGLIIIIIVHVVHIVVFCTRDMI
jgi:hypothetical protein